MEVLRPRRSFVRRSGFRDARLIVIACEGAKTERAYFEELVATLVQRPSRVHVELLERGDGLSAPEHVLKNLDDFRKQYLRSSDDELWAVIDYDRWGESKLSKIASLAQQKQYQLAVSRPCFEFWLLLHHQDPSELSTADLSSMEAKGCEAVAELLRAVVGSASKSLTNAASYMQLVGTAIDRAASLDTNPELRWPSAPGSRVYQTVRSILKPLQEYP
jgi:hypothetical protein